MSSVAISESYYNSINKSYTEYPILYKISNIVANFDAERFAAWMKDGYASSTYKSQINLANVVGSNQASISRWMNAAKQSTTDKATQPPADVVIKLAVEFKRDINEALIIAGHAPLELPQMPAPLELSDFDGLDNQDLLEIKNYADYLRAKKKTERERAQGDTPGTNAYSDPAGFRGESNRQAIADIPFEGRGKLKGKDKNG